MVTVMFIHILIPKYHESHELVWEIYLKHNSTIRGTEWINFSVCEQKSGKKSSTKYNNNLGPIHCIQHTQLKKKYHKDLLCKGWTGAVKHLQTTFNTN